MTKQPSYLHQKVNGCLLALLCTATGSPVLALSTDKDQPIEVEADTAELDDTNNISIYTGDVVVIQGSIKMTGDKMTVHHTEEDELDYMIMEGRHATYRQLPDNSTAYDQAVALQMEYYERKNLVILIRDGCVKQDGSIITGQRIEYDTLLSQVKAFNKPKDVLAHAPEAAPKKSRVKLLIKNNKTQTASAEVKKPTPEIPVNLQKDCKIKAEKPPVTAQ